MMAFEDRFRSSKSDIQNKCTICTKDAEIIFNGISSRWFPEANKNLSEWPFSYVKLPEQTKKILYRLTMAHRQSLRQNRNVSQSNFSVHCSNRGILFTIYYQRWTSINIISAALNKRVPDMIISECVVFHISVPSLLFELYSSAVFTNFYFYYVSNL